MTTRKTIGGDYDKTMVLDPTRSLGRTNTSVQEIVDESFYNRGWWRGYWAGAGSVIGLFLLAGGATVVLAVTL